MDGNGFGSCAKAWKGQPICYVTEPTSCSDILEGPFGKWSVKACDGKTTRLMGYQYINFFKECQCQALPNHRDLSQIQGHSHNLNHNRNHNHSHSQILI